MDRRLNMKKIFISILLSFILLLSSITTLPGAVTETSIDPAVEFRGVWVSSVFNLDFPSAKGLSGAEIRQEIDAIINRAVYMRMNAIILQVRPTADSLYPSEIFPWSEYLTGTQGVAPSDGFDPLAYWVAEAHKNGLELHAWINPYRITHPNANITDVNRLSESHPARLNPSWSITYNNALYFDPGNPEARQLIVDGVLEIIENYNVDGIHLDDYFYPDHSIDFPDENTFRLYGQGANRENWRRENVNELVRQLQAAIKNANPYVRFGISPFAIWRNKGNDPLGSETRGNESFSSHYADTRLWVKEGWVDYICPQIYWAIGFDIADYSVLLPWWEDVCRGTGVDLYIGHAAYREADGVTGWTDELRRQLSLNSRSDVVNGSIFFRIGNLNGIVGDRVRSYYLSADSVRVHHAIQAERQQNTPSANPTPTTNTLPTPTNAPTSNAAPTAAPAQSGGSNPIMTALTVSQPSENKSVTDAAGYNIIGTCVPGISLFINGNQVTNITAEGFFNVYMPLTRGENTFTLTQTGQPSVTRVINNRAPSTTQPQVMNILSVTNAYPPSDEHASPGDVITLSCTAPAGSVVTARLGSTTVSLTQSNTSIVNSGQTVYAATFTGSYTIPQTAANTITEIGKPAYTAFFNEQAYMATSEGTLKSIGSDAPYYATVVTESAWVFLNASTSGGSGWQMLRGQIDRVTGITHSGWVRIASGGWLEPDNVIFNMGATLLHNVLTEGRYTVGAEKDMIIWKASSYTALNVDFDGKQLTIRFGVQKTAPDNTINITQTMFENLTLGSDRGAPAYSLSLRDGVKLEGFYVDYLDGELRLHLKKRKTAGTGNRPLEGFTFVVDAGHGGTDSGALGPMGRVNAEKDLNLSVAVKLRDRLAALGATVVMARTTDINLTLSQRTELSRRTNPDMFISIHGNSVAETTDATNVRGLTMWYRNPSSLPLATSLMTSLFNVNPGTTRRMSPNHANFYVCRPAWTPSVLVETSFICNIHDFSWMINEASQNDLALAIANAVVSYYR